MIVFSDIDNTILAPKEDKIAEQRFKDFIYERRLRGDFKLVYATGRNTHEYEQVSPRLPVPDMLVTAVGTEIWGISDDGLCFLRIPWDISSDLCFDKQVIETEALSLGFLEQQKKSEQKYQCGFLATPTTNAETLRVRLLDKTQDVNVIQSGNNVDVIPCTMGKGEAIKWVLASLAPDYSFPILTIGDSENDISMLTYPGAFSWCPCNAHIKIKNLPGILIAPFECSEGVMYAIENVSHDYAKIIDRVGVRKE